MTGRGADARSTDIGSGRGVPAWIAASLNFCARCATALRFGPIVGEDRPRSHCPSCGHIAYVNPRLVVTALPVTDDGIVLIRRGIAPGYGLWAQPGGFLEVDETIGEAAIRETLEETGLRIQPGELIGFYTRLEAAVVVVVFEASITGGEPTTTTEALEVRTFPADAVPWSELAFSTTHWALVDWLALRRPDLGAPEFSSGR